MRHLLLSLTAFCSVIVVTADDGVAKSMAHLETNASRYLKKQIEICEIPAPTFEEEARGKFMAAEFRRVGLTEVVTDNVGNVLGWRRGEGDGTLVVCAHLDTVFPKGTDVSVRQEGELYRGRGMTDNSVGLMALLALAEALDAGAIKTRHDLLFVASVCEEGLGDLRGVKHLLQGGPLKGKIDAFIAVEGADTRVVVNQGLGSKRYRVTVSGPGGHSWGHFGRPNPIYALSRIMTNVAELKVPRTPRTTFNVGRIGGGTSVNSIPESVWCEIDMRSTSRAELKKLEEKTLAAVYKGFETENARFRQRKLELTLDVIGDRPSGVIPESNALVKAALRASRQVGIQANLSPSSTDANLPISMGIPAVAIGAGGIGGDVHSPTEWYMPKNVHLGLQRLLLTVHAYDLATMPAK
jgi:acetylornithine deacetylase/succinyl-diaminopimelate desuccinylase-like protein